VQVRNGEREIDKGKGLKETLSIAGGAFGLMNMKTSRQETDTAMKQIERHDSS
jgi:hypothetical protein